MIIPPPRLAKRASAESVVGIVILLCIILGIVVFALVSQKTLRRLILRKSSRPFARQSRPSQTATYNSRPVEASQATELNPVATPPPKYEPPPPPYQAHLREER